jgi:hypothetical protein
VLIEDASGKDKHKANQEARPREGAIHFDLEKSKAALGGS